MITLSCAVPRRVANQASAASPAARPMPFEALETPDSYLLYAELPGAARESIDVQVEKDEVRISARREPSPPPEAKMLLSERRGGDWERRFALPQAVDSQRAQARYNNGILELCLPKLKPEPLRRLAVN